MHPPMPLCKCRACQGRVQIFSVRQRREYRRRLLLGKNYQSIVSGRLERRHSNRLLSNKCRLNYGCSHMYAVPPRNYTLRIDDLFCVTHATSAPLRTGIRSVPLEHVASHYVVKLFCHFFAALTPAKPPANGMFADTSPRAMKYHIAFLELSFRHTIQVLHL